MRHWLSVLLVSALLVTMTGSAVALTPTSGIVTVRGQLKQVTSMGPTHYEVGGYVVLHDDPSALASLAGQEVVATGAELSGPSIYMRKVMQVTSITPIAVTIPVIPGQDPVSPGTGEQVGNPSLPSRYFGTDLYVLFGMLEMVEVDGAARFFLYVDQPVGQMAYRVRGEKVDLRSLVGRQVGALALPMVTIGGTPAFEIESAIALDTDLADLIHAGQGMIYFNPPFPISVLLRGQPVHFDQDPILANGRTLVGLRKISEALGATVHWSDFTQTATVSLGDRQVLVRIGSNRVVVRHKGSVDAVIMNDIAPVIVRGRTMVPIRVLTEGLGLQVNWNDEFKRVELY